MSNESNESNELIDVVVASFADEASALTALEQLKAARDRHDIHLKDVATLRRDPDNKLHIRETDSPSATRGAIIGGAIGGLIGLLLGPVAIPAAAAGAAIGALTEKVSDSPIGDHKLKRLGESLRAGAAAIVAMTDPDSSPAVQKILTDAGATVIAEGLNAYTVREIAESNNVKVGSPDISDDESVKLDPIADMPVDDVPKNYHRPPNDNIF